MKKRLLALALSLVMVITSITMMGAKNTEVMADTPWKAITAPAEGKLIGAGYINIVFNADVEGAKSYQVYFDGEPVYEKYGEVVRKDLGETTDGATVRVFDAATCGDTVTCEVYTTDVAKHEAYVVATLNDTTQVTSETVTFYVSKKGMAMGGDMSDQVAMNKLNVSWYYNWGIDPFNNSIDEGVDHVPMMWGGAEDNIEAMEDFSSNSNYFLGFNEPDIGSQANMTFWDAIDVWNEYISPLNVRKISPAPAAPGGNSAWLSRFMNGEYICQNSFDNQWGLFDDYFDDPLAIETKMWKKGIVECNNDVDAVVLHYYRNTINLEGLIEAVNNLWNTYHKPVWITELSLFGVKGSDSDFSYELPEKRAEIAEYVHGIVDRLDDIPYVERYCWFSYDIDSTNDIDSFNGSGGTAMFEYASGNFTDLGRLYSSIGNPEGYDAYEISDDEMFVYIPPETTTAEPTTEQTTTVASTTVAPTTAKPTQNIEQSTAKKLVKPGKVKLKTAKNNKKKSVKLTWNKVSGATKYKVQYTTDKKFKKKVKSKTTSKVTFTISKLTKKKKYYFRVRAINTAGNGKWSNIKSVKVKK